MKKQSFLKKFLSVRGAPQVLAVTGGLIILYVVFAILNENFRSLENFLNLLRQIAPIFIIGIGQTYVLITGNIDLSIGSVVGMSCMISAVLMTSLGLNPWVASLITIVVCLLVGAINAVLVANVKLPPFIATLGTMSAARGIAQIVNVLPGQTSGRNTDSISGAASKLLNKESAEAFKNFFYYGKTLGVYNGIWISLILLLVFYLYLSKTRGGRHIYATGSNIEAARLSGVSVSWSTAKAYLISAFCAGFVGIMTTAQQSIGTMDAGNGYELYAVAASVIGGVSTLGGSGLLFGTYIGASIWSILQNGLTFANVAVGWRNIVVGVIVVVSVSLDVIFRTSRKTKKVEINPTTPEIKPTQEVT